MAYSTGISSSVNDLVTAILSFAVTNGWTAGSTWTSGAYTLNTISKNSIHFVFQHKVDELLLNTAKAVTGTGLANAQTNASPLSVPVNPIQGPHVGYHLFTDGTALHCVVEVATNSFTHINFGEVTKIGTFTGGQFVTASSYPSSSITPAQLSLDNGTVAYPFNSDVVGQSNGTNNASRLSHMRMDVLGTNRAYVFGGLINTVSDFNHACWSWNWSFGRLNISRGPNTFNGRAAILPFSILCASSSTIAPYYQVGAIPNAGTINILNIAPKDIVNTDWMVFPIGSKGTTSTTSINSGNYGIAYKK